MVVVMIEKLDTAKYGQTITKTTDNARNYMSGMMLRV